MEKTGNEKDFGNKKRTAANPLFAAIFQGPLSLRYFLSISGINIVYEIRYNKKADHTFKGVYELFAPESANNLLDKIESSIMGLTEFPERFQLIDEEPWKLKVYERLL